MLQNDVALLFDVRRSIRYHRRRENFFDKYHRVISFGSLVFTSFGVGLLLQNIFPLDKVVILWASGLGGFASALQLMLLFFQLPEMSRKHSDLASAFIALEREFVLMDKKDTKKIQARILEIEKDEPPIKRYIDILCHNELIFATISDKKERSKHIFYVPLHKKIIANFWNGGVGQPKTLAEREKAKKKKIK